MLACTTLRATVVVAAVLFLTGFFLQLPAVFAALNVKLSPAVASAFGLVFMSLSFAVLVVAAGVSLVPYVRDRLHHCEH